MKTIILVFLLSVMAFGQSGKSVLTQAQKDSIGAMIRDSSGYVTPENYGAVGDGVTDDLDAIVAAYNSGANHIIFSKDKTYKWNYNSAIGRYLLKIDRAGVILDGNGCTITNDELETVYVFDVSSDSVIIKNFNFVFTNDSAGRNQPTTSQRGIRTYNYDGSRLPVYDLVIDNCSFYKCQMQLLDAYRPRVTNIRFYNSVEQQMSLNSGEYGIFDNIQFYNSGGSNVQNTVGSMPFVMDSRSHDIYNNFSFTNCDNVGKIQSDEDSCVGNILSNWVIQMDDTVTYDFVFATYQVDYLFKDNTIENWIIDANNAVRLDNIFEIKQGSNNLSLENIKVINASGLKFGEIVDASNILLKRISGEFKGFAFISGASSDVIIDGCVVTVNDTFAVNVSNINNLTIRGSYINNTQTTEHSINVVDTGKTIINGNRLIGGNNAIYLQSANNQSSVTNNYISDYATYGILQISDESLISGNVLEDDNATASVYAQGGTVTNNIFLGTPARHVYATYPSIVRNNNFIGTATVATTVNLDSATIYDNDGDLAAEVAGDTYTASLTNDYTGTNYVTYTNPVKWTQGAGDSVTQKQGSVYNEANAYAIKDADTLVSHISIVMPNNTSNVAIQTGNLPTGTQFYAYLLSQVPINGILKIFIYDANNLEYYNFSDSTWGASSYIRVTPDNSLQYLRFPFVTDTATRKARFGVQFDSTGQAFEASLYYWNISTNPTQGLVHIYNDVVTGYGLDNAFFTTVALPDASKITIGTKVLDTTENILKVSNGSIWADGDVDSLRVGVGYNLTSDSTSVGSGDLYFDATGIIRRKY